MGAKGARFGAYAALLLPMLAAAAPAATPRRLPPIEACGGDPSLRAFRAELAAAVAGRSKERLLALVADDILVDFGGGSGRAAFVAAWKLDRPEASPLWAELGAVLRLGCAREGDSYYAPALFAQLGDEEDVFELVVAVNPGSPMLAEPRPGSRIVKRLDWDVLTLADWDGSSAWVPVKLADGRSGYVRRDQVRSPLDHRALFRKVNGRWRITAFVAGD